MSDSDGPAPARRVLRSIGNEQPLRARKPIRVREACRCEAQLTELRNEVSELTKTINEMNSIVHAKLLFPHLSLAEALAEEAEVTYAHVKPPKRPHTDSALYLPDIPDGFSDSSAHSLAFRRRTKATTTEQECKRASKKLHVDFDDHGSVLLDAIKVAPLTKRAKATKRGEDKTGTMRATRSGRVAK